MLGWPGFAGAVLVQFDGTMSGLMWNDVSDGGVLENPGLYTRITADGTTLYRLDNPTLANIGEVQYTMWYDDSLAGNAGNPAMSAIDWSGGQIVGTASGIQFHNGTNPTLDLEFTLNIQARPAADGDVEDLPTLGVPLGDNVPIDWEMAAGSFMEFTLNLNDANGTVITGTWNFGPLNSDPFNGIMIDPSNAVPNDIAFFFRDGTTSFHCRQTTQTTDPCGPFGFRTDKGYQKKDLKMFGAAWGQASVPEPGTIGLLAAGLFGLGAVAARRMKK
jgi:hypothetical protein